LLKYLVPRIALADLPPMFAAAALGAVLAGMYGIGHDQFTYSISPEYFTNLKFEQFRYADFGWGERVFVAEIGFLASWWVGMIAAWFVARRLIPGQLRSRAWRQIAIGFGIVFGCGLAAGLIGYAIGIIRGPDADYSSWRWAFMQHGIEDEWAFVRVAYIHNASYLGGLIGLIAALIALRPKRQEK
jgi:hypothetical protein